MAEIGPLMPPPTLLDPPYIMMFLVGGAALLWSLARPAKSGRRISDAIDQTALTGFQTFRIMGGVFILGWLIGEIPWQFALPAGLGDIWAGIAGHRAMNAVNRGTADAATKILWANVIGLADFVVAVLTGLITSEGFLHLLARPAEHHQCISPWIVPELRRTHHRALAPRKLWRYI